MDVHSLNGIICSNGNEEELQGAETRESHRHNARQKERDARSV